MSDPMPATAKAAPGESRWGKLRQDTIAGLINAVVSVPDGLASAALAGVNPVYGLYTSIAAPVAGSALVSAQLMQVSTTTASALAAGQAIASYPAAQRDGALFLLVLLVGVFLAIFGVLRLGRLVRFVSHAVMTGFLTGVAAVLVLDQLAPLVGYSPRGANEIVQFVDLLRNPAQFNVPTVVTGVVALALVFGLARTRLATLASLVALVVPTLLVVLLGWGAVQQVADVSPIPRGLPTLTLPDLGLLSPALLLAALSLAVVIAVQGAGVSQSVENPDGRPVNPSRDMIAQGVANAASGLLSGIPAGGSVGQTALNVSIGARTRWAGIFGGVWMLAIVLLFPSLVGRVPMAVLAALMIQAGISAINTREVRSIWKTGGAARWAILVTFAATLVLSVPVAVAVGVGLTVILFLSSSASDVTVRERLTLPDGRVAEVVPPKTLPSEQVIVLDVYGSLFFAGARTLREALPSPQGSTRPAVVLRLRGRTRVGATLIEVLDDYADDLAEVGGRLYLSGVDEDVGEQLREAGKLDMGGSVHVVPAGDVIGASTDQAVTSARGWLGSMRSDTPRMKRA
ncbi:SulP family inorganic anion transporter [Deinococcus planocerae]|uniref:SulP family inorganic anion transporter n=1 Tax=Deinococcus planocerae TaxID=1737569 RepID=UPI001CA5AC70|nr:SulP family inorganic anion transporter [Deinococcus planocerae]